MHPMQPVTSTFTTTVQQNSAIIELRFITDHCACTTASSQLSFSFDRPVRTADVIKASSCAFARPVENWNVWTRPKTKQATFEVSLLANLLRNSYSRGT